MIPIGAVAGTLANQPQTEANQLRTNSIVQKENPKEYGVNDHYNLSLVQIYNDGYSLDSARQAERFTSAMNAHWQTMLPHYTNFEGGCVSAAEMSETVAKVNVTFTTKNSVVDTLVVHITLKEGFAWVGGSSRQKQFTTAVTQKGSPIQIYDHYNIDMNKLYYEGYQPDNKSFVQKINDDLAYNPAEVLPYIVTYNDHSVSVDEINRTVASAWIKATYKNNEIYSVVIYVKLKDGLVWNNGGGNTQHFVTETVNTIIVDYDYTIDINKMHSLGYDMQSDAHANRFANDLSKNFITMLPKLVNGVTQTQVQSMVKSATLSLNHEYNKIKSFQLHITLNSSFITSSGSKTPVFNTNVPIHPVAVNDHYNIDIYKLRDLGYDMQSDAHANKFASDLSKNFATMLPKIVNYQGHNVSQAEIEKTVKSVSIKFGHDHNRISFFQIYVTLNPYYVWSNGTHTEHFTTGVPANVRVDDHYNVDLNKLYATGYKLDTDAHANQFANDLSITKNFQSLLPKITSYQGHNVSSAEVNKTVQSVAVQFDHKGNQISAFRLYITLKAGYVWSNGTQTENFTTSVPTGTHVNDNYTVDMNKFYATGYDLDTDAHANKFASDLSIPKNFQSLLPKITSYQGHSVSSAEVNKTVQSVSVQFEHNDNQISAFRLYITLKDGYIWNDGTKTNDFTTSVPIGTRVDDHYNVDVNKLYATGYKLDTDAHANQFAHDLSVPKNFQSLLPKITSYQGHGVSSAEVAKTVKSVSVQFDHKDNQISSFRLYITLKDGFIWNDGTQTKDFSTNVPISARVNDHYNVDMNKFYATGYDMDTDAHANKFASDLSKDFVSLLPQITSYQGHNVSQAEVEKTVQSVAVQLDHKEGQISAFRLYITLKDGYIWNDGAKTKDFTTSVPINTHVVHAHYNLDINKIRGLGYDMVTFDDLNSFVDDVSANFATLLPKMVSFKGQTVSQAQIEKTVQGVWFSSNPNTNNRVTAIGMHVILKSGYTWSDGSNTADFVTNIPQGKTVVNDHYNLDINKMKAIGYDVTTVDGVNAFASALEGDGKISILPKVVNYNGQSISQAEIRRTVKGVWISSEHNGNRTTFIQIHVVLKSSYTWSDGSDTAAFSTEI